MQWLVCDWFVSQTEWIAPSHWPVGGRTFNFYRIIQFPCKNSRFTVRGLKTEIHGNVSVQVKAMNKMAIINWRPSLCSAGVWDTGTSRDVYLRTRWTEMVFGDSFVFLMELFFFFRGALKSAARILDGRSAAACNWSPWQLVCARSDPIKPHATPTSAVVCSAPPCSWCSDF